MVHSFGCYGISRANCAESTVGGGVECFRPATHRLTSALRRIQGAPVQACVAGNCFSRISRKTVVGVTPRTAATSLTDIRRACAALPHGKPEFHGGCAASRYASPSRSVH